MAIRSGVFLARPWQLFTVTPLDDLETRVFFGWLAILLREITETLDLDREEF